MASMTDDFLPSIVLAETHFPYLREKGIIAAAVARLALEGFYRSLEIAAVGDGEERRRVGKIVREHDLSLTMWLSAVLVGEDLNLSSTEERERRRSVDRVKEFIPWAEECAATRLAVVSGPDPGPADRQTATERLVISLRELCQALQDRGTMTLILEPLDRGAHKNGLIGPTAEAVALMKRLREVHPNVGLSWDTAHVALCGEDVFESLASAHPYIHQIHLANAVLDRADPQFGDHHMPFGSKGFLTVEKISAIFRRARELGLFGERRPCVAVEVRTLEGQDPWRTEQDGRQILNDAWEIRVGALRRLLKDHGRSGAKGR